MKTKSRNPLGKLALGAFLTMVAIVACSALGGAQSATSVAPIDAVRIQNLAPLERATWVTATVPLEDKHLEGQWNVRTDPQAWAMLGARAAKRTRLLHLFVKLKPYETRAIQFVLESPEDGTEEDPNRAPPKGDTANPAAIAFPAPALHVLVDGTESVLDLGGFTIVENAGRVVVRSRGRIPGTMLVAEAWFYVYPAARVIPFELLVICSDPRTKAMRQDLDSLELRMPASLVPVIRHRVAQAAGQPRLEGRSWRVNLLGPTHFADAQGRAWSGVLLRPDGATPEEAQSLAAELHGPAYAMAKPEVWERRRAWGPWGVLPDAHPSVEKTFPAYIGRLKAWLAWTQQPRELWAPAWLQVKRPAQTGDQYDFGVTKLSPALATKGGGPGHIDEALFRALKTACRRGYYREADGSPVLQANHPQLVMWGQGIHYHPGVSPDRLGKDPWVQQPDGHGWEGWDREHVSLNSLCGAHLLTGSHLVGELVRSNVESWLLGTTTKAGWSTTGRGAPRSVGRTLLAMAWCYLCTGDERIPERMRARLDSSYGDLLNTEAELVVLGVHGKDGRKLGGKHPFWMPWQESLGVVGLDAAYQVSHDPRFLELAKSVARNVVRHGWWERSPGSWTVGDAIAVLEAGKPLPAGAYDDPTLVKDHSGTDFDLWALPAVKLCRRYAELDRDDALRDRCDSILRYLEARRLDLNGEAFDRFGEWGAVR